MPHICWIKSVCLYVVQLPTNASDSSSKNRSGYLIEYCNPMGTGVSADTHGHISATSTMFYVVCLCSCILLDIGKNVMPFDMDNCVVLINIILDRGLGSTMGKGCNSSRNLHCKLQANCYIVKWLLWTVCRNLATPYPTLPLPLPYDFFFPEYSMFAAMPVGAELLWLLFYI